MERGAALFGKATFVNPCLKTFQDKFFLEQDTVDSLMENSEKPSFFELSLKSSLVKMPSPDISMIGFFQQMLYNQDSNHRRRSAW